MEFTIGLQKKHAKLRQKYYFELVVFLVIFLLGTLTLLVFETIELTALFSNRFNILWAFLIYALVNIVALIYFPWRAKRLQKALLFGVFTSLKADGIDLIVNPQGGQNFDYKTLLAEGGVTSSRAIDAITRYEYAGRLVHVLHFKAQAKPFVLIHIPALECPYYLQINNGHFPPVYHFQGDEVVPVSFVSRNKLNYFATKGPSDVKVYLRRRLERKFNDFIKLKPATYQYIKTYNDEFLRLENYGLNNALCLTTKYNDDYFNALKDELKYLQALMFIMLEKGR